jgi:dynein heavy chain
MEDEVKKFMKTLKDMKVDKRCNAYAGLLDDIKKWLVFLPLVQELRKDSMRPSHWKMIQDKCGIPFTVNDSLLVRDVYELNLMKI